MSNVVFYLTVSERRPPSPPDPRTKKGRARRHARCSPRRRRSHVDRRTQDPRGRHHRRFAPARRRAPTSTGRTSRRRSTGGDTARSEFSGGHDDDDDEDDDGDVEDPTVYRGDKPQQAVVVATVVADADAHLSAQARADRPVARAAGQADRHRRRGADALRGDQRAASPRLRPRGAARARARHRAEGPAGAALGARSRATPSARRSARLSTTLCSGPLLTFEGKSGERFGGDLERVGTTPHFGVKLGDGIARRRTGRAARCSASCMDATPTAGDVVLGAPQARPSSWRCAARPARRGRRWPRGSPSFPVGGDWVPVARLQVVLPRA